jgi:phenylalanyl-tRNA synthetase beta chain
MLCSPDELATGTDAEGILILGTGDEHRVGADLRPILGEVVLDVDVKPNRGDALSMVGLAREVAAFTGGELREPRPVVAESGERAEDRMRIRIDDPELCPRFTARYFEGGTNGVSPEWLQRRLLLAGMRPVSAVVDVTNYVMHELGQPMHAYDADRVPRGRIVVRRARDGEELETIDHVRRRLDPSMLVIADAERAIGLAGIMGGASTEVTGGTTRVILESAAFHGPTIRATARLLGLRSEASARHEKGIPWPLPRVAADRAAELIAELTGAEVAAGIVDNDPAPRAPLRIGVDLARTARLLGVALDANQASRLLRPLGFEVERDDSRPRLGVTVPPHRLDVSEPADVAEELARAHGYDRIAGRLPHADLPPFRPDPSAPRHGVRRILAGLGLDELVTYALIGPDDLEMTRYRYAPDEHIRLVNPLSEEHSVLRPVVYPSLLRALRENVRMRRPSAALFEVGKVYWMGRERQRTPRELRAETAGTGRFEAWEIGIALLGPVRPRSVHEPERAADVDDVKGIVEALHIALGAPAPRFAAEPPDARHPHRHPGRTALILDAEGRAYGSLGEVHPAVAAAWDLPGRPVDAAVALDRLLALVPDGGRAAPVPAAQPIDRDLALVVSDTTPAGELLRLVRQAGGPLLVDARLFDVYRGEQLGAGRVSYALSLRFQPTEAGDEAAVEKALNRIRGSLRHHLSAELRS